MSTFRRRNCDSKSLSRKGNRMKTVYTILGITRHGGNWVLQLRPTGSQLGLDSVRFAKKGALREGDIVRVSVELVATNLQSIA